MIKTSRSEELLAEGRVEEALGAVEGELARSKPRRELLSQRALVHSRRRHFSLALADLDRALALAPRDPRLHVQRSETLALMNRLPQAARAVEAALRMLPQDEFLLRARLRLLLQSNRIRQARRQLTRLARGSPQAAGEARFYRGLIELKAGRLSAAARAFDRAAAPPADENLVLRSRFYEVASRGLARSATGLPSGTRGVPRLFICGLGLFPPYTTTLEVLHAIRRSDVVFNNLPGIEVREFLTEFCPRILPAMSDRRHNEKRWVERILQELRRGRSAAFVTRGHPLILGKLARLLIRSCRARGVPYEAFGAVSSIDVLLARTGQALGDDIEGISVLDWPALSRARALNTEQPLIVYFYDGLGAVNRLARALERFYPPTHPCWMHGPKYDTPPTPLRLSELPERYDAIHASHILYLPGR